MSDDLDDLVRRRAAAVERRPAAGLEPDPIWAAGRRHRRRRRGVLAGAGTILAAALAGGITVSALGDYGSPDSPAVAATPSGAATPAPSTASSSPSYADPAGLPPPVSSAVEILRGEGRHIYIDPTAPAREMVNFARTQQDIGTADIKLAALPATALGTHQTPAELAAEIGSLLGDKSAVVIVIVGQQPGAAAGELTHIPAGQAQAVMSAAQSTHAGPLTLANVQGALDSAIATYVEYLTDPDCCATVPSPIG